MLIGKVYIGEYDFDWLMDLILGWEIVYVGGVVYVWIGMIWDNFYYGLRYWFLLKFEWEGDELKVYKC